jgi:hypothetical protein
VAGFFLHSCITFHSHTGGCDPVYPFFLPFFFANPDFFFEILFFTHVTHTSIYFLDLDVKPPRGDEGDDGRRTTFGSTTSAPDPFTALSAADLAPSQDHLVQGQADRTSFVNV